jgi:hypothetical protein
MGFSLEVSRWEACIMSIRDSPKKEKRAAAGKGHGIWEKEGV